MPERGSVRTTAAAALLVAGLVGLAFAGAVLSGEQFYFRDLSQNHGPLLEGARALLKAGEPPWWNPWAGGGQPLASNANTLLLHPSGVLMLLMPPGIGLKAGVVLGSLLGAIFMTLLLRDAGRSFWAAATGAIVFGLSGYSISIGTLPNLLAAASWVPAALFFIRLAGRRLAWLPAAALTSAFVFVPCEPVSALVLGTFALVPLGEGVLAAGGVRASRRRRGTGIAVAALGLGLAAASYQVIPGLLWSRASARGAGLTSAEVLKWSLDPRRLPEVILPGFLGDPSLFTAWWGSGLFETGYPLVLSLYVGAPALLLAAIGTWVALRRGLRHRSLAATARSIAVPLAGITFLVLAMGSLLRPFLTVMPGGGLFRYPEKLLLGTLIAVALQAGLGVDRLAALAARRGPEATKRSPLLAAIGPRRDWPIVLVAALTAIALQAVSLLARPEWAIGWFQIGTGQASLSRQAFEGLRLSAGFGATTAGLFALAVLVLPPLGHRARGAALFATVAVSLLAGTLVFGPLPLPWRLRANPSGPQAIFTAAPFFGESLARATAEGGRVFRFDRPPQFALRSKTGTLADGFSWDRRSLGRSSASEFGIELAYDRSTDLLNPLGQAEALAFFKDRPPSEQARFWDLAGVRYVIAYGALDVAGLTKAGEVLGQSNPPVVLYESHRALPRVRLVAAARHVGSDREAFEEIVARGDKGRDEVRIVTPLRTDRGAGDSPKGIARPARAAAEPRAEQPAILHFEDSSENGPNRAAMSHAEHAAALHLGDGPEPRTEKPSASHNQRTSAQRLDAGPKSYTKAASATHDDDPAARRFDGGPEPSTKAASANHEQDTAAQLPDDGSASPYATAAARPLTVVARGPGRLRVRVGAMLDPPGDPVPPSHRGSWLVIAENDVPGWRATVDGNPARIQRADGMQMAIELPDAAAHEVSLSFFPPGLLAGIALSGAGILASFLIAASARRNERLSGRGRG